MSKNKQIDDKKDNFHHILDKNVRFGEGYQVIDPTLVKIKTLTPEQLKFINDEN